MLDKEVDLKTIIDEISKTKGFDKQYVVEIIEDAMLTVARRKLGLKRDIEAHYNPETNEVEIYEFKTVVGEVTDDEIQMLIDEAHQEDPDAEIGDTLGFRIPPNKFGRIDAQVAKQVLMQKIRDAEREHTYNEYKDRVGELVTGVIRRFEKGDIYVDLGRYEAILPMNQQVSKENYRVGDRVQAYVLKVDLEQRGSIIVLSRTHVGLIMKLFEKEVPEIAEGIVSIMQVAREPGSRTKIAVASRDPDVDPVGACVGMKGSRVQSVVQELRGEKIDIVPYDAAPAKFVCNALAPAEVSRVIIDEEANSMEIIVPDDQLSLAIGRKGQNVRLAAHLCGWTLEVRSEAQMQEIRKRAIASLLRIQDVNDTLAQILFEQGYRSADDIANATAEELAHIPLVTAETVPQLIASAAAAAETEPDELVITAEEAVVAKPEEKTEEALPEGAAEEEEEYKEEIVYDEHEFEDGLPEELEDYEK